MHYKLNILKSQSIDFATTDNNFKYFMYDKSKRLY